MAEFICDQLATWARVTARPLFGGWGIYDGAVMFGLISRDAIYFRVDETNRPNYEIAGGAKPFTYEMPNGKTMETSYCEVPAEILDDTEELARWAAQARTAAIRAKNIKAKKTPTAPRA
ncbi:MAG: TfoX/Sxy family protein, partial [Stellaceae bacterium]